MKHLTLTNPKLSWSHTGVRQLGVVLAVVALGGCSQIEKRISEDVTHSQERSSKALNKLLTPSQIPLVINETTPRFAGRSVAVQESQFLPTSIGEVTLRYPGRHTLLQAADLITQATKIPVLIAPDALLPASRFSTLGGQATETGQGAQAQRPDATTTVGQRQLQREANANMVSLQGGSALGLTNEEYQSSVVLNYSGNLEGLLNQIAAKTGLYWRYDGGAITFSRLDTQTFIIKAHQGITKFSSDVTGTNTENSGGSMSVSTSWEMDFWSGLDSTLKSLVSQSGRYVLDTKNGTVTVTDSVTNVRSIGRLIERYNELALRQIVLNVEVLQVDLGETKSSGVDWSVVSNKINALSNSQISISGPPSLITQPTGSIGLTLNNNKGGRAESSKFLIRALETFGKVSTAYSVSVTTGNRQPVPVGALNNLSYVKQSSPPQIIAAPGSGTSAQSGALVPGVVQTGFAMTLVPTILDSNRIMLQSSMTISSLRNLKTFEGGGSSVQTPEVDSFNTSQRVSATAGDTIILMGYEREGGSWFSNNLAQDFPIPGFREGKRNKISTVVLVTPLIQEF